MTYRNVYRKEGTPEGIWVEHFDDHANVVMVSGLASREDGGSHDYLFTRGVVARTSVGQISRTSSWHEWGTYDVEESHLGIDEADVAYRLLRLGIEIEHEGGGEDMSAEPLP